MRDNVNAEGKVNRFERVRGRGTMRAPYNYMTERMKLAKMLQRPAWVEFPKGDEPGTLADYPLIHLTLAEDLEMWIADDDECIGLLGLTEQERLRLYPDTQWSIRVELKGEVVADTRSATPTLSGLTDALQSALAEAAQQTRTTEPKGSQP